MSNLKNMIYMIRLFIYDTNEDRKINEVNNLPFTFPAAVHTQDVHHLQLLLIKQNTNDVSILCLKDVYTQKLLMGS